MSQKMANAFLYSLVGLIAVGYIGSKRDSAGKHTESADGPTVMNVAQASTTTRAPEVSLVNLMPDSQRAFMAAVRQGRDSYNAGQNDMAKGSARPKRARAICSAMRDGFVNGWVGTVYSLSSNNDGKGVLAIHLGEDVYVKTWNNALSDGGDRTLIDPDSALFSAASGLRQKQMVVFSGTLAKDRTDCFRESSMTLEGSMTEPEFIMRFSQVSSVQ